MKTTVKLGPLLAFVMQPSPDGFSISFAVIRGGKTDFHVTLTPDEAGATIFGLEQALEARAQAVAHACTSEAFAQRLEAASGGVRCHGDHCAAGQLPCPTPRACLA